MPKVLKDKRELKKPFALSFDQETIDWIDGDAKKNKLSRSDFVENRLMGIPMETFMCQHIMNYPKKDVIKTVGLIYQKDLNIAINVCEKCFFALMNSAFPTEDKKKALEDFAARYHISPMLEKIEKEKRRRPPRNLAD